MAQQVILPDDELVQKAGAVKAFSLGLLTATVIAQIIIVILWLFNSSFLIIPFSLVSMVVILTCLVAYWLVRFGHVRVAGYLFIIGLIVICSIVTYLFGGAAGPIAIIYAFPILMTAIVISLRSTFLIATVSSILFLGVFGIEMTEFFPQVMAGEWEEIAAGSSNEISLAYLSIPVRVVSFYLIAFLSWFAASRLNRALQDARRYAGELQTANEVLQSEITERKWVEQKLKESEEKFRTFMETASDLMNITDKDGNFTYVNDSMARTLGYSKEELIGMHITQILSKESLEKDFKPNWGKFLTNGEMSLETTFLTKEGKEIYCEMKAVTVFDNNGNYVGTRAVHRDLTERKRLELELREKNEDLEVSNEELRAIEEEVRSSNEELEAANEELREAQAQLVRSEKLAAIGQLAGGVGHELRNPLGAIKNAVYYIRGKVNGSELAQREPRVMEFLEIVNDEVNSSEKIINDLLSFSRVGKPAVSLARIDRVVEDAVAHTIIPENIELTKNVVDSLPEIEIDTEQIRQVLVNMITNAVQAMPGGGKLIIKGRQRDSFIELDIADTGGGVSARDIEKIFDPLFTLKAKGIGLGLAVCKTIIERHAGHIEVKSSKNRGTTFTIKLPLKQK